jgi:hypothetical protein
MKDEPNIPTRPVIPIMGAGGSLAVSLPSPEPAGSALEEADVGPKKQVGSTDENRDKQAPVLEESDGKRVVQLDPTVIMEIELVTTQMRLAEADEKLALIAVKNARQRKSEVQRAQDQLLNRVSKQVGVRVGSSLRLLDKDKGLCQVE